MSTEESNIQPSKKPIIKPMDKHRPIIGEGAVAETPQTPQTPAPAPGVITTKDKHRPIADPQ